MPPADRLVSVLMPVRGRADLLVEAVRSILAQEYASWELLVVDDASDEDMEGALRAAGLLDDRIRVLRQPDCRGANVARQRGFEESAGEYVCFFDGDDVMDPRKLAVQAAALEAAAEADGAIGQTTLMRSSPLDTPYVWNSLEPQDYLLRFLRHDVAFHTSAPLWRRRFVEGLPPWRADLKAHQDFEYHIVALAHRPRLIPTEDALVHYRMPSGKSTSNLAARAHIGQLVSVVKRIETDLAREFTDEERAALARLHVKACRMQAFAGPLSDASACVRSLVERGGVSVSQRWALWLGVWLSYAIGRFVRLYASLGRYRLQGTPERWTLPVRRLYMLAGLEDPPVKWWMRHQRPADGRAP